jgi:hypothetical protein
MAAAPERSDACKGVGLSSGTMWLASIGLWVGEPGWTRHLATDSMQCFGTHDGWQSGPAGLPLYAAVEHITVGSSCHLWAKDTKKSQYLGRRMPLQTLFHYGRLLRWPRDCGKLAMFRWIILEIILYALNFL